MSIPHATVLSLGRDELGYNVTTATCISCCPDKNFMQIAVLVNNKQGTQVQSRICDICKKALGQESKNRQFVKRYTCCAYFEDHLVVGSACGAIDRINPKSGEMTTLVQREGSVTSLFVHQTRKIAVVGHLKGDQGCLLLINLTESYIKCEFDLTSPAITIALNSDGCTVFVGCERAEIYYCNVATKSMSNVQTWNLVVTSLAILPSRDEGKIIGCKDGKLCLSKGTTSTFFTLYREGKKFEGALNICALSVAPDGEFAIAGTQENHLIFLEPLSMGGVLFSTLHQGGISSVSFVPGGKYFISASGDGAIRLWSSKDWVNVFWCPELCESPEPIEQADWKEVAQGVYETFTQVFDWFLK